MPLDERAVAADSRGKFVDKGRPRGAAGHRHPLWSAWLTKWDLFATDGAF